MKRLITMVGVIGCVVLVFFCWIERNTLKSITLTSPNNTAMYNKVDILLAKPAPVYIEYTEKKTGKSYRTRISRTDTLHHIDLLLLKANTEYTYRVIIDNLFKQKSKELTFKTREQSPWLVNHWFNEQHPHDTTALGDGMILVCFGRLPGYMALIDNEGEVRWVWQVDDIGVRAASITPRGTFLAMLRPFVKDVIDDYVMTPEQVRNDEHKKPMRRGSIGFAGGTGLAEVSLTGETMWRLDLDKIEKEKDYQVIHHDILMDEDHHIHTLYRPKKVATIPVNGKMETDTLGGDGIMVIDTLGNILKTCRHGMYGILRRTRISQNTAMIVSISTDFALIKMAIIYCRLLSKTRFGKWMPKVVNWSGVLDGTVIFRWIQRLISLSNIHLILWRMAI